MGLHWMQGLAYCKTLARETQGCAGPELIQWQELLRARVRLGLPQEYEAWCRCRRASVRLSRRDLRSALPVCLRRNQLRAAGLTNWLCLVGWQLHRCDGSPVRRWRCSPSCLQTTAMIATSTVATGPRRASATATRCATGWPSTARFLAASARHGRVRPRARRREAASSDAASF